MHRRRVVTLVGLIVFGLVAAVMFVSYQPVSPKGQELEQVIERYHQDGKFSGVALVLDRGNVILKQAYGLANREQQIPYTSTTKFRIASLTKLFVATQIMQLHEQGKIRFTDSVAAVIQDFPAP